MDKALFSYFLQDVNVNVKNWIAELLCIDMAQNKC